MLGEYQGIVYLDSEISDGAFELRVPEQELAGPQVAHALADDRDLHLAQAVSAVGGAIESDQCDLVALQPTVLTGLQKIAWAGSG